MNTSNHGPSQTSRIAGAVRMVYDIFVTANGLTPGGSSTVHIYTQTIHRTTQIQTIHGTTQIITEQHK